MAALSKRSAIYLDPALHQALRINALETSHSMSEIINEAVKVAFAEDAEDLAVFEERTNEPLFSYERIVCGKDGIVIYTPFKIKRFPFG
jgi:hypothetical protein